MTEDKKGIGKTKLGLLALTVVAVVLTISNLWVYANLSNQIEGLETDNDDLNIQVGTLQTDKTSLEDQVTNLQTDKGKLQSEVNTLKTEKSQLQSEVDSLEAEISDLEWEIYLLEEADLHKVGVYWHDNHPLFQTPYVNIYGYIFNTGTLTAYDVVYTVRIYDEYDTLLKTEEVHLGDISGKSYESFDVDVEYSGDADYVTTTLDYW